MIVKLRTNGNGWEYFDCPSGVKARLLTKEQARYVWDNKDTLYIIRPQLEIPLDKTNFMLINIYDNCEIYTNDTVYLLNNDGKTIEKLN